jgi:serine protease Do
MRGGIASGKYCRTAICSRPRVRQILPPFMRLLKLSLSYLGLVLFAGPLAFPVGAATNARSVAAIKDTAFPTPPPAQRGRWPSVLTKPGPASVAELKAIERHVQTLIGRVAPSVVALEVSGGTGSGVVVSRDGLVLTAGHVSGRAGREVRFRFADGRTARGVTLGNVGANDTGLVRITDPGSWPFVPMGELESAVMGDWVVALGHPGGFDPERARVVRLGRIIRLIPGGLQTDCTISPGDSGGPLFDMQGRVIAIHSFISNAMTENFHVPISKYRDDWPALITPGASTTARAAAYLGATGADDPDGCRLTAIESGGPAALAGLKQDDLIVKIEERYIFNGAMLKRWLEIHEPGDRLKFEVKRGTETLEVTVSLAAPPKPR